ncbi:glycoside hydrolase family 61 protein [Serendipita vermifera MAFF 305830]|uniref:lytic cellulose monooxygenase (C4-dehydrogenating) n=1 Tax=Serendipita vermifera MAFF 305830 TaxID=933852 RepID=A0A0C3BCJ9_SERVB|nr:glycoside hydrolase family 61 protein [Serendipita vermifera MAFF 305830]
MLSFICYFVFGLLSLRGAFAHWVFSALIVDGEATENWQYVRNHTNAEYPIKSENMTTTDMRCNVGAVGTNTSTAPVKAGSTVGFTVNPLIFHSGVVDVYMARAPGKAADFDGSGDVWFKIYEIPPVLDGGESIEFSTFNATQIEFPLPAAIEDGEYLLRIEFLALHLANYLGKAEFYIGCAQVAVTGGGGGKPTKTVAIPGAYSSTDPGIYMNIYTPIPTVYVMPGPPISDFTQ